MTRLKTGDVVPIRINEGVTVKIEDKPFFTGEMGEVAGKSAISLQKTDVTADRQDCQHELMKDDNHG